MATRIPIPLRVVALAEFAPRTREGDSRPALDEPIPVKPAVLDDVMEVLVGRVPLALDSPIRGRVGVDVPFRSLAGLRPDRLAQGLPHLAPYAAMRAALVELRDGQSGTDAVRERLESLGHPAAAELARALGGAEPAPSETQADESDGPSPPQKPTPEGGLFDLVATDDAPAGGPDPHREAESAVRRALSAITAGARVRTGREREAAEKAIAAVDSLWSDELRTVFHHPEFRRLESLWRGLRLMLQGGDFTEDDLRVEVLHAPRDEAGGALRRLAERIEDEGAEHGVTLVIAAYDWDTTGSSWTDLRALAEGADELPAPVVTGVGAGFLGLERLQEAAAVEDWRDRFLQDAYMKFRGLRDGEASAWLGLIANGLPLRAAYGTDDGARRAVFQEYPENREPEPLWGNPAWGVGAIVLDAHARTGWPTDILAPGRGGRVENLPLHAVRDASGRTWHVAAEAAWKEGVRRDLNGQGLCAWSVEDERDHVLLAAAPVLHVGGAHGDADRDTLPYRLFTARCAQLVRFVAEQITAGSSEDVRAQMAAGMAALLGGTPQGILGVDAEPDPNRDHRMAVTVTLDATPVPGAAPPLDLTVWLR